MHILILGGGLVGMAVTKALCKHSSNPDLRITVVDPKDFIEVRWAAIRAMFDSAINHDTIIPHSDILASVSSIVTTVSARATSIDRDARTVSLDNGDTLSYDACLVTVGSLTSEPILVPQNTPDIHAEQRRTELKDYGDKLAAAGSVLVVGGGAIGSELAGDIAGYAEKAGNSACNVTLVQSADVLVPGYGPKAARLVKQQLEKRGVTVKLNTKAFPVAGSDVEFELKNSSTGDSETAAYDIAFKAIGVQPSTPTLFGDSAVENKIANEKGFLLTDDFARLPECGDRVFAFGDCVQGEPKNGANAMHYKDGLAKNILYTLQALANDGTSVDPKKLTKLKSDAFVPLLVTTGPNSGVAALPFGTTSWILPAIKNKNMMIFAAKGYIGW